MIQFSHRRKGDMQSKEHGMKQVDTMVHGVHVKLMNARSMWTLNVVNGLSVIVFPRPNQSDSLKMAGFVEEVCLDDLFVSVFVYDMTDQVQASNQEPGAVSWGAVLDSSQVYVRRRKGLHVVKVTRSLQSLE
jgi:hypothetical protein